MAKSIKLQNDTYIDSEGITHNKALLSTILDFQDFQERYMGVWYDGRSIYRKICKFTPSEYKQYTYSHGISGIVDILPMSCAIFHREGGQYVPFSLFYPSGDYVGWGIGIQFTRTSIITWIGQNMFNQADTDGDSTVIAVLYYTK